MPEFVQTRPAQSTDDEPTRQAAIFDVWAFGARGVSDILVDVTVRNPAADRYRSRGLPEPGGAARIAEEEKQKKYPPKAGRCVRTMAFETWGRLGEDGEALLTSLEAAAAERDRRTGRGSRGRLQRWRAQLDGVLQKGVARALESSRLGLPGYQPQRREHNRNSMD